ENNIEYVIDKTNLLPIYSRNKVRLELIPYIQKNFNPNIVDTLWRTSQTANIDSSYLDEISSERYHEIVKEENTYRIILDGLQFKQMHRSIQNRIIRLSIMRLMNNIQGVSEHHITSVVDMFLEFKTGKQMNLHNGLIGRIRYDDLIIEKEQRLDHKSYEFNLHIGKNVIEELDTTMDIKFVDEMNFKDRPFVKYIDFHKIKGNLYLRNRRNGDRITTMGMKRKKKVKDYIIDK